MRNCGSTFITGDSIFICEPWISGTRWATGSRPIRRKSSPRYRIHRNYETAQIAFIKASREAQFLFDDASGIHKLLEQVHSDSIGVIGYKRDIAHHPAEPQQVITSYHDKEVRRQRFDNAIPLLEQKLAKYLDFHSLSAWDDTDY